MERFICMDAMFHSLTRQFPSSAELGQITILCLGFVIQFCFSVHSTVIEECFSFLKLLFCYNLSLQEQHCVHLVKK